MTPRNAESLFKRLFSAKSLVDTFGEVDVTIIPHKDVLDSILTSDSIKSVRIIVNKPNPDRGAQAERQFMARLDRMNVRKVDSLYVAEKADHIIPDDELRTDARVASRNGRVDAVLVYNGRSIDVSTVDTPFEYVHEYDNRNMAERDAFAEACDIAKGKLNE